MKKLNPFQKSLMLLSLLLIPSILMAGVNINKSNIDDKKQNQFINPPEPSYVENVSYNDYWAVYSTSEVYNYLTYNFSSSKTYIGITVRAINAGNYSKFVNNLTHSYYTLSSGSQYSYSGTWSIPYCSVWYVVFLNLDSDQESTILTFNAAFFGLCNSSQTCGFDSYEPNGNFQAAYSLSSTSNSISGSICSSDIDYFKIYLSSGSTYRFTITWSGSTDLDLELYNSDQTNIQSSSGVSNTETITYYASSSGYYYIQVVHYTGNTVSYTLTTGLDTGSGLEDDDPFNMFIVIFLVFFIGIVVFIFCIIAVVVKAASGQKKKTFPQTPPPALSAPTYVPNDAQNVKIGQPATLVPNQTPPPYTPSRSYTPNAPYTPSRSYTPNVPYAPGPAYTPNAPYAPGPAYTPNAPYAPGPAYTPNAPYAPGSTPVPFAPGQVAENNNNTVKAVAPLNNCPYCGIDIDNDVKYALAKKQDAYCRYCGSKLN